MNPLELPRHTQQHALQLSFWRYQPVLEWKMGVKFIWGNAGRAAFFPLRTLSQEVQYETSNTSVGDVKTHT